MKLPTHTTRGIMALVGVVIAAFCLFTPVAASAADKIDLCADTGNVPAHAVNGCNNFFDKYVNPAIVALTAFVGIGAVASIIVAGIQYSTSADDPGTVSKAKQRIFNTILGLVAYIFLIAFIRWLALPGGIF